MCGITGILSRDGRPRPESEIVRMTKAVDHRGPDGVGFLQRERVSLGHRRLAVIDPELGQQPMSNEDESVSITCNGEIYNYLELKAELHQKGHRFATNSDTEVII